MQGGWPWRRKPHARARFDRSWAASGRVCSRRMTAAKPSMPEPTRLRARAAKVAAWSAAAEAAYRARSRDGDRVMAVVRGSAVNQGWPKRRDQRRRTVWRSMTVIREALAAAHMRGRLRGVDYVETHGTKHVSGRSNRSGRSECGWRRWPSEERSGFISAQSNQYRPARKGAAGIAGLMKLI